MIDTFPDSRTFTWPLLKAYYGKKDYHNALKVANRLIDISADNNYSKFEACYYKAEILFELEKFAEATNTVETALNLQLNKKMLNVEKVKEKLLKLKSEIEKKKKEELSGEKEVLTY